MTDNEIIKALECCTNYKGVGSCVDCPLANYSFEECADILRNESRDLINRQKAEIERLKAENEVMRTNCNSMYMSMPNIAKAERVEARKEFWDRLKKTRQWDVDTPEYVFTASGDNLLKEMDGEQ